MVIILIPMQNSCLGSVGSGSCSTQNWPCDRGAQYGEGGGSDREGELHVGEGGGEEEWKACACSWSIIRQPAFYFVSVKSRGLPYPVALSQYSAVVGSAGIGIGQSRVQILTLYQVQA